MIFGFGKRKGVEGQLEVNPAEHEERLVSLGLICFAKKKVDDRLERSRRWKYMIASVGFHESTPTQDSIQEPLLIFVGHCLWTMLSKHRDVCYDPQNEDRLTPAVALALVKIIARQLISSLNNEGIELNVSSSFIMADTILVHFPLHSNDAKREIAKLAEEIAKSIISSEEPNAKKLIDNIETMSLSRVFNASDQLSSDEEIDWILHERFQSMLRVIEPQ